MSVLIPVEPGSAEWHEHRRHGVTASEIAGILGIAPDTWTSPFNLYWAKRGAISEPRDREAMAWGRDLEAAILRRFAREHPELIVSTGALFRHDDRPWQMATPDGLAYPLHRSGRAYRRRKGSGPPAVKRRPLAGRQPAAVVQVKTAYRDEAWGAAGTDQVPVYYVAQVRWEMAVMGCEMAYLPVLFGGQTYREYVVRQDAEDLALMLKEGEDFLDRIARDDPPDIDWRPATTIALRELYPDVEDREVEVDPDWQEQYHAADADLKAAEKRKAQAANAILAAMGSAKRAVADGRKIASRSVYDQGERVLPPTTVRRLYVNKPPRETP